MTEPTDSSGSTDIQELDKTVLDLPDHFMVSVFKLVSFRQRLRMAEVCKKWNELVHEGSLWSELNLKLLRSNYSLAQLNVFTSQYGTGATKQLSILGNYNSYSSSNANLVEDDQSPLSYLDREFVLETLAERCVNLTTIDLDCLDLSSLSMNAFVGSFKMLNSFSLKLCRISDDFFTTGLPVISEQMKSLYLVRTGLLNTDDIESICVGMPRLTTLVIMQASSTINDRCVELIASRLHYLEQLDLTNTNLSDNAIYKICESPSLCERLTRLNLSMSSSITNQCLPTLANNLKNLRTLYLTSCFGISNLFLLQNLNQLLYLNINNTSITNERIKDFLNMIPKCEVDYGHLKMLSQKKMWTINGSRNSVCSF